MGTITFSDLAFVIIAMLLTRRVRKIKTEIKSNILTILIHIFPSIISIDTDPF